MKLLILVIVVAIAAYIAWTVAGPEARAKFTSTTKTHGPKIAVIILAALAAAVAFYALPAIPVLN